MIRLLLIIALVAGCLAAHRPGQRAAASPATLGTTATTGGGWDTGGDSNGLDGDRVVAPVGGATVTALSAYVGPNDPNDLRYGLALYADSGGKPGALVVSATGALAGSGWNTLPLAATLAGGAAYWLVYNTGSDNAHNLLYVTGGSANQDGWSGTVACCAFPNPAPSWTLWSTQYSIYATLGGGPTPTPTAPPTATNSPVATATATNTAIPTSTVTGTPPATATATALPATGTATPAPPANTATNTPVPSTATPSVSPTPTGHLIFDDEFNASSLDWSVWVPAARPGDQSNGEQQCYLRSNVVEAGGVLTLTDRQDSSCAGYSYTSGAVSSGRFNFTYGTFEVRAQMPRGQGQWPALWLLGANCQVSFITDPSNVGSCQWPTPGSNEIDMFEGKQGLTSQGFFNTITGTSPNTGTWQGCNNVPLPFDTSAGYHIYDLMWAPGSLRWQIDGTTYCSTATLVPSTPMFIILNIALGGSGGGTIDPSVLPQAMRIDYVRVYQ